MKKLLLAVFATVALLVSVAAPAAAKPKSEPKDGYESERRGEDDGTDMATFGALMLGGIVVTMAMAGLVRAGHRIPH